jgi:hypothetical protein
MIGLFPAIALSIASLEAPLGRRQLVAQTALYSSALLGLRAAPSHATVAFDMTRYGDRELQIATINRLKQAVRDMVRAEPELVSTFFELALLDALDYQRLGGAGGLDGSVRFSKFSSPSLSRGVAAVDSLQRALVAKTEVTYADMLAYAGGQSIEIIGGNRVLVQLGRDDAQPSAKQIPALDWSPAGLDGVRAALQGAGLGSRELVLLGAGLGVLRQAAQTAKPSAEDELSADMDDEKAEELAGYAEPSAKPKALGVDVRMASGLQGVDAVGTFGAAYLQRLLKSGAAEGDKVGAMLLSDTELRALLAKYADKPALFGKDLAEAYASLTTLGKFTSTRNS